MGHFVLAGVGALLVFFALKDGSVSWGRSSSGGQVFTREEHPVAFWGVVALMSFLTLYFFVGGLAAMRAESKG